MTRAFHPCRYDAERLLGECTVRRQRRSGPGGQHRNKVETGIFLQHQPTGIEAAATERRSQQANLKEATRRLRLKLAIACRQTVAADDLPHELWRQRCGGQRIVVSRQHDDFATLLAEALDFIAAAEYDPVPAAERLSVSRSQLTRFIGREPAALRELNAQRRQRGLAALR